MEHPLSQTIDNLRFIFAILFLLMAIFFFIGVTQEDIVKSATMQFEERVRLEGYIDQDMYETYMKKVSIVPLKITMRHSFYNIDGSSNKVLTVFTEKDMLNDIYSPAGMYKFNKGDDFYIEVRHINPTPYQIMLMLMTKVPAKPGIIAAKGGMIYNVSY